MAFFNEIGAGRYNRFLQKFLSMKGGPPARQLASEIAPVIPLFHGAENRYLEHWERYALAASVGAGAGVFGGIRLRNPATSNLVAVIEFLHVTITGGFIQGDLRPLSSDLGGVIPISQFLDPRTRPFSSLVLSSQNNLGAAVLATIFQINTTTGIDVSLIQTENQEIPILPGQAFTVGSGLANTSTYFSAFWRERPLEESERT